MGFGEQYFSLANGSREELKIKNEKLYRLSVKLLFCFWQFDNNAFLKDHDRQNTFSTTRW